MKGKKIKGVGDGDEDGDAVNAKQLNLVEKLFTILNNTVAKNNANIAAINVNNGYYYYTKELQHNNGRIVFFFTTINEYPFESFHKADPGMSNNIKNALRIKKKTVNTKSFTLIITKILVIMLLFI